MKKEKKSVLKYWFVSYHYVSTNGFGFGNCWVSGGDFLEINAAEKWVKDKEGFRAVRVMYFQEIPRAQYIHGLANLEIPEAK